MSGCVAHPESFVAEATFYKMLASAGVEHIKVDCRVTGAAAAKDATGVSKIKSITVLCENDPVTATVFIDASYDGDVMVAVGDVDYTWGREAISQYNESYAGARKPGWSGVGGPHGVNPFAPDGSLIKYVYNLTDLPPPGEADDALMAFQHRMCTVLSFSFYLYLSLPLFSHGKQPLYGNQMMAFPAPRARGNHELCY
jgi:hypothetical protein